MQAGDFYSDMRIYNFFEHFIDKIFFRLNWSNGVSIARPQLLEL